MLVRSLTAACLLSLTPVAAGQTLPGYTAGTGTQLSSVVIDFAESGGPAYAFGYRHDGTATGLDALLGLDAAGPLTVFTTEFSFGTAVDGFAFGEQSQNVGFDAVTGRNWSYWIDGGRADTDFDGTFDADEAVLAGAYVASPVGAGGRLLSDGSVDGYIVNVSSFNSQGNPATATRPAAVPEPAAAVLLAAGGLTLLRRRRDAA